MRILILMISVILISSCCQKGKNEAGNKSDSSSAGTTATVNSFASGISNDSLKVQIGRFIDEWHNAASRADMQAYFEKIDGQGIYIGTDATENWTKQAFYDWSKPYFDKGKAWSFQAEERNIYLSGDQNIVWFDEKLRSTSGPLRGSGVVINNNGQWKIMHYVLSLPVPNEKLNEVMELIGQ